MNETNYNDLVNIVRLIRSENVGPITFFKLIEKFGDFKEAIDSIPSLVKNAGKNKINIFSESMAKKEIDLHLKNNVKIITYKDSFYPPLLKKNYRILTKLLRLLMVHCTKLSLLLVCKVFQNAQLL